MRKLVALLLALALVIFFITWPACARRIAEVKALEAAEAEA